MAMAQSKFKLQLTEEKLTENVIQKNITSCNILKL